MNITEEIIKNLEPIGYLNTVSTMVKYFINENIKGMYGTPVVNREDVSISYENDSIDLKSIFADGHNIISVNYDANQGSSIIKCDRVVKDKITRVFEIIETSEAIENRFMSVDGTIKRYTYNKATMGFEFCISHKENDELVIDYKGSLIPTFAKIKNYDWFSYYREYPPKDKQKSIFKKLVEELSNRGCTRKVTTSSDVRIDLDEFPNNIFGELISDARVIFEANENNGKRKVRI